MKLRIPRHHAEFLKAKGALDHFVSAKLSGQNITAKWLLLEAGKDEIKEIQEEKLRADMENAVKEARTKKLQMFGILDKANKGGQSQGPGGNG